MRYQDRRRSDNVEDRRRLSSPTVLAGGGVGALIIIVIAALLGVDPRPLLQQAGPNPGPAGPAAGSGAGGVGQSGNPQEDAWADFIRVVLADTEDVWTDLFRQSGKTYRQPKLVLFSGQVRSACGFTSAAVGPFYCPADEKVYLDLSFFEELRQRFHAPGDFAQAYVIAHEVGHHVQKLVGISDRVHAEQLRANKADANDLSVRLELQADFLAGVWAHHAQKKWNILEEGDVEEALRAANAIGDDRLQKQAQGYVVPDSFTHGTSEQRVRWFLRGLKSGDMSQGDTFGTRQL